MALYQDIMNIPGLSGSSYDRQKQYYESIGSPMGPYTGSYNQNVMLLNQMKQPNYGLPQAAPQQAQPTMTSQSLADQYAEPGMKAAPTIPQWENVLDIANLKKQYEPLFQESAAEQVTPDLLRQYMQNYGSYMNSMARSGGGRFGAGWGGIGGIQADAERQRREQMQTWVDQLNQGLQTWYDVTGQAYEKARSAGDVYSGYKIPTYEEMVQQMGGNIPETSQYDWTKSPFLPDPDILKQYKAPGNRPLPWQPGGEMPGRDGPSYRLPFIPVPQQQQVTPLPGIISGDKTGDRFRNIPQNPNINPTPLPGINDSNDWFNRNKTGNKYYI